MTTPASAELRALRARLSEAEAVIVALVSGQVDAVVDPTSMTPVLLSKAQDSLRRSEEQYRLIVESTSDGVLKVDGTARIEFVNRRLAQMLGYEPYEMVGRIATDFLGEMSHTFSAGSQEGLAALGAFDATLRHRDGSDIFVNIAGSPVLDEAGGHIGMLGVVRDFTEQQKMRSQLMANDRMATVGTLAAGVAHEVNNPLAAMIANIEHIADRLLRAAAQQPGTDEHAAWQCLMLEDILEPLADARAAAERVRLVVRDLRIFSRSPVDEPAGAIDVESVIESSLRVAWNEIRHRARVVRNFDDVPGVDANEARLGQVFLNLIMNAAQALPEGHSADSVITVATRLDGERVIVEVSDTGVGIDPKVIGRVFDAFFTTKPVGVGTGLGLAICHRLVSDMRGTLTVESTPGKGSTFRVSLPVAAPAAVAVRSAPIQLPQVGRRGRVLVVDDEDLVLRAVKRVLQRDHDVITTSSAIEALALSGQGEPFDLILCDLMMPDMTGMELHAELERAEPGYAARMVFLTGGAFTSSARQFLAEPGRHCIDKPFEPAELRRQVHAFIAVHDPARDGAAPSSVGGDHAADVATAAR